MKCDDIKFANLATSFKINLLLSSTDNYDSTDAHANLEFFPCIAWSRRVFLVRRSCQRPRLGRIRFKPLHRPGLPPFRVCLSSLNQEPACKPIRSLYNLLRTVCWLTRSPCTAIFYWVTLTDGFFHNVTVVLCVNLSLDSQTSSKKLSIDLSRWTMLAPCFFGIIGYIWAIYDASFFELLLAESAFKSLLYQTYLDFVVVWSRCFVRLKWKGTFRDVIRRLFEFFKA